MKTGSYAVKFDQVAVKALLQSIVYVAEQEVDECVIWNLATLFTQTPPWLKYIPAGWRTLPSVIPSQMVWACAFPSEPSDIKDKTHLSVINSNNTKRRLYCFAAIRAMIPLKGPRHWFGTWRLKTLLNVDNITTGERNRCLVHKQIPEKSSTVITFYAALTLSSHDAQTGQEVRI